MFFRPITIGLIIGVMSGSAAYTPARADLGAPLPEGSFSRLEAGSPEAAFAGGPLKLTPNAIRVLRARFQGDKVPLIPEPFRRQLDAALAAREWPRVMARKSDLGASRGQVAMLMWEQTRFLATGSLWLAQLQARDLATSGLPGATDAAIMMWLYTLAATMTDGHQCPGDGAREAHLSQLRGAAFEPVLALVRKAPEGQLAAQRDIALKLEAALAPERLDDAICHGGAGGQAVRPDDEWRPAAARTREMLVKHLNAMCALVRAKPMTSTASASTASPVSPPSRR